MYVFVCIPRYVQCYDMLQYYECTYIHVCMYRIIPRLRPLPLLSEKSCSSNNEVMPILLVSSCQKKKVICKRLVREEARLLVSPIIETTTV